jgi:hypothetical protein
VARIGFNRDTLLELFAAKAFDDLAKTYLSTFTWLEKHTILGLDAEGQATIDLFCETFLDHFLDPSWETSDALACDLIAAGPTISNVVAMSKWETTDRWLAMAVESNSLVKILVLYSPRNSVCIIRKKLFDASPELASLWWSKFSSCGFRGGMISADVTRRMLNHYQTLDPRLAMGHDPQEVAFSCSFVSETLDRGIRQAINRSMRGMTSLRGFVIANRPDPNRIAVVSGYWRRGHSVHRTLVGYAEGLKASGHHLTLLATDCDDKQFEKLDRDLFDDVRRVYLTEKGFDFSAFHRNEYGAVWYPDVGMTLTSLMMSNLRIAPVQLMGTGHPISTFGSEIDYFISGAETDTNPSNYAERLVLLPGMGAVYERPTYELKRPPMPTDGRIHIACSWYGQKINHQLVSTVRKIIDRSTRPLTFHIFSGSILTGKQERPWFAKELVKAWGTPETVHVFLHPHLDYADYMAKIEACHFALDCFPYGGSNTVSDVLWCRKPVVCLEGKRWPGRIGPALLRRANLPEMVATDEEEYVKLALDLIGYPKALPDMIGQIDLAEVYDKSDGANFSTAVDWLIANHDRVRRRWDNKPIHFSEITEQEGVLT